MRRLSLLLAEIRAELRYHLYSRSAFLLLAVVVGGSFIAFLGSVSNAKSAHKFFLGQVRLYEQQGVSLREALEAPVSVTTAADGSQIIDNPLKYDYLETSKALHAVDGFAPLVGTVLDLVTFFVMPMTFIFLGAYCATFDRRAGTLKLRACRSSWATITTAKLLALAFMAAAAVVTCAASALLLTPFAHLATKSLEHEGMYQVEPTSISPMATKLAMTFLIAVLFGLLGYAIGAATNSTSWPMILAAGALFALPFVGPWDVRNLLAVLSVGVFDFWGQFKMRPPMPVSAGAAGVALALYAALGLIVSALLPRQANRFS